MSGATATERRLTFRALGSAPVTGVVKNPRATLGKVAALAASHLGIAGTFECMDEKNEVLAPETPLGELPRESSITLLPELTPA